MSPGPWLTTSVHPSLPHTVSHYLFPILSSERGLLDLKGLQTMGLSWSKAKIAIMKGLMRENVYCK